MNTFIKNLYSPPILKHRDKILKSIYNTTRYRIKYDELEDKITKGLLYFDINYNLKTKDINFHSKEYFENLLSFLIEEGLLSINSDNFVQLEQKGINMCSQQNYYLTQYRWKRVLAIVGFISAIIVIISYFSG